MRTVIHYDNALDRREKVTIQEREGLTMINDIFDKDWVLGQDPHGTMEFVSQDLLPRPSPQLIVRDLEKEFDGLVITLKAKGVI